MTIDELLCLIYAKKPNYLTSVRKLLLSKVWEGKTYAHIALELHYEADYLKKIGCELWHFLSELLEEPINKTNFRSKLTSHQLTLEQQHLIEKVQRETNPEIPSKQDNDAVDIFSGPVPLNSPFYIDRYPIEQLTYQEISNRGSWISIRAPKSMGKSSLLIRIIAYAKTQEYRTASIDFQQVETNILNNLETLLRWFCVNLSQQLELPSKLEDYWQESLGSKSSCTLYIKQYLLKQIDSPLVLVFNEVHRFFKTPAIAEEFILLLRSWYEEAKQAEILTKLRFVLVYSTEVNIPLSINQVLVNLGLSIKLPPFTLEQVQCLAIRHRLTWADGKAGLQRLAPIMVMTGGHPYLVRLALYYLYRQEITLEQFLQEDSILTDIYQEHLWHYSLLLQEQPQLAEACQQVMTANTSTQLKLRIAHQLKDMGLIKFEQNGVIPSCELYRLYFGSLNYTHQEVSINTKITKTIEHTHNLLQIETKTIERKQQIIKQILETIEQRKQIMNQIQQSKN